MDEFIYRSIPDNPAHYVSIPLISIKAHERLLIGSESIFRLPGRAG